MKKIISTLALCCFLSGTISADISQKQVDTYLEASGTGAMLNNLQSQISYMVEAQIKSIGQDMSRIPTSLIVSMKDILSSDANIEKFTKGYQKLDPQIYHQIIDFYQTKEGKKSADVTKSADFSSMEENLMDFMQTQKNKPFSKSKILLINSITKALGMIEMQSKMTDTMMTTMNSNMPKILQMPESQLKMMSTQMKPMMEQQAMISMHYNYKDYTEAELKNVLTYVKSKAGLTEAHILMNGTMQYVESTMSQIMQAIMQEVINKMKSLKKENINKAA